VERYRLAVSLIGTASSWTFGSAFDETHRRLRAVADDGDSLNAETVIAIEEHPERKQNSAVRAIARKVTKRDKATRTSPRVRRRS
jgi:hypothetical protein